MTHQDTPQQEEMKELIRNEKNSQVWLLVFLVGIAAGVFVHSYLNSGTTTAETDETSVTPGEGQTGIEEMPDAEQVFRKGSRLFNRVAQSVRPSVVNITTKFTRRTWLNPVREDENQGTGVIIDREGHILTNHHVVQGEDPNITVSLDDGRMFEGTRIGFDPNLDLAIVKIDARDLTPASMGKSKDLEVGDWVLAMGSPFGLEQSVTSGIVSALDRKGEELPVAEQGFIQTDASINPGNSGGPLVNLDGEVVGINTMIVRGSEGIGFAAPIDVAIENLDRLKEKGPVEWGMLGIKGVSLDEKGLAILEQFANVHVDSPEELAQELGLDEPKGSLIIEIQKGFPPLPAQQADLQRYDVIVEMNGEPVQSFPHLKRMVMKTEPGTEVTLTIVRDGERKEVDVTVGSVPTRAR